MKTTDQTVSFGIMGVARINRKVIPAIQSSRYAKVAAIASRELERAAAHFPISVAIVLRRSSSHWGHHLFQ